MSDEELIVSLTRQENELNSLRHRVKACETQNATIRDMALSVNKLAVNMEHMLNEQKDQGRRLTALERQPAEQFTRLRSAFLKCVFSSVLGALLGALMAVLLK